MKYKPLLGYIIHQRAYQEKRALYTFFSQTHGLVVGVGQRGLPLFVPMSLFATGKTGLKSFSQPNLTKVPMDTDTGDDIGDLFWRPKVPSSHYAALYLNELLYRLLPNEDACPNLWQAYTETLQALKEVDDGVVLRILLRRFELLLFAELGVLTDFKLDSTGAPICVGGYYHYVENLGFVPSAMSAQALLGEDIFVMATLSQQLLDGVLQCVAMQMSGLNQLGVLHRKKLDALLNHQPLHSRKLWQDQLRLAGSG